MSAVIRELAGDEPESTIYSVILQDTVAASTTEFTQQLSWESPIDGVVQDIRPFHVPGSQDALQVRPLLESRGGTSVRDIVDYAEDGEQFITGEPVGRRLPLRRGIERSEAILIMAKNTNANNAYRFRYVFTVAGAI